VAPVTADAGQRSHTWLEPLLREAEAASSGAVCSVQLDVQGVHCAACVWLMNETFRRRPGAVTVTVNPALGKVKLWWKRGTFDVLAWVRQVEGFGYQFGPSRKEATARSTDLPLRLGVCACLTMNVMLFSISFYFGLSPSDPEIFRLFTGLSLALSSGVFVIGGWPFFKSAVRSLKSGLLHLDLPIALGIALVFPTSLVQMVASGGRGDFAYLDTLNTFITLMLLGRLLQARVLERNRRFLLEDDGAESLVVRKVVGDGLVHMKAVLVQAGDVLLVAPGDLVPVDAALVEPHATVSTDWITGEATPRTVKRGGQIRAGSFNSARVAFHVVAATAFAQSALVSLLRQPAAPEGLGSDHQRLWNRLAKGWVVGVLALSAVGLIAWWPHGIVAALNVAAALLVVTCPCAIGIATPLAYELVQSSLRHSGFYVRSWDLLDRLVRVRKLIFDKTGTLTLGHLELLDPNAVRNWLPDLRDIAYNLAVRSAHPVSACLTRELERLDARYDATATVQESPGRGMEWQREDGLWRLGRGDWAAPGRGERCAVLSKDLAVVATLATKDALRTDAQGELRALQAQGYAVWLLSGDAPSRVAALASTLGIRPERAMGDMSPDAKAAMVEKIDRRDTLYLGDGVNDALAFGKAFAAGTPAIDRPVMPSRSDFFLVGDGLKPIKAALTQTSRLRRVVQRLLLLSLAYNLLAVTTALAGKMSPLLAAVSMPASTLLLLALTAFSLRSKSPALVARGGAGSEAGLPGVAALAALRGRE
jgi:Cu2+-exporting ATPase